MLGSALGLSKTFFVGGVWKKEEELKQLKSEVAALERKIQLELAPPKPDMQEKENVSEKADISQATNDSVHFIQIKRTKAAIISRLYS